jgi:hypothetical protein
MLLFAGRYARALFRGMNRWGLRLVAYAGLMTDAYLSLRLDLGGEEPDGAAHQLAPAPAAAESL